MSLRNSSGDRFPRPAGILIVDDHPLSRQGIRSLLAREPDLRECGEAHDAEGALKAIRDLRPDLVLLDLWLGDHDGLDLLREIRRRHADVPVIVFSLHDEASYAERALRAGARGYVTKREAADHVVAAIREVLQGGLYVDDDVCQQVLEQAVRPGRGPRPETGRSGAAGVATLSDRELEVFHLIGQGRDTRQIAERLHLSPRTVEMHRARIRRKMALHTATELVQQAVRWVERRAEP
jgi:DNA-binding NarL/FixJ family response regulator